MKNPAVEPATLLALAVMVLTTTVVLILRLLIVPLLALALVAVGADGGRRVPAAPPAAPAVPLLIELAPVAAAPLEVLTVAQLRARARRAGLPRALAHRGRRDALVAALVGLEVALV